MFCFERPRLPPPPLSNIDIAFTYNTERRKTKRADREVANTNDIKKFHAPDIFQDFHFQPSGLSVRIYRGKKKRLSVVF